jgi:hypothetical protein
MMPDYEIELGRGIGNILLGIQRSELTEILGVPDEIEYPEDTKRADWETCIYNSINCSFSFSSKYDARLIEISVENGYFHIRKKIRVGTRKEDLLAFGDQIKIGSFVIEEKNSEEYPLRESISYKEAGLLLLLDDGKISVIQISPLIKNDNIMIWPEEAEGEL